MSTKSKTMAPAGGNASAVETTRIELKADAPDTATGFLDEAAVLARVPVSRRTWYSWREKGLPYIKCGARVLYDWPAVRAWLLRQQRGA